MSRLTQLMWSMLLMLIYWPKSLGLTLMCSVILHILNKKCKSVANSSTHSYRWTVLYCCWSLWSLHLTFLFRLRHWRDDDSAPSVTFFWTDGKADLPTKTVRPGVKSRPNSRKFSLTHSVLFIVSTEKMLCRVCEIHSSLEMQSVWLMLTQ